VHRILCNVNNSCTNRASLKQNVVEERLVSNVDVRFNRRCAMLTKTVHCGLLSGSFCFQGAANCSQHLWKSWMKMSRAFAENICITISFFWRSF